MPTFTSFIENSPFFKFLKYDKLEISVHCLPGAINNKKCVCEPPKKQGKPIYPWGDTMQD